MELSCISYAVGVIKNRNWLLICGTISLRENGVSLNRIFVHDISQEYKLVGQFNVQIPFRPLSLIVDVGYECVFLQVVCGFVKDGMDMLCLPSSIIMLIKNYFPVRGGHVYSITVHQIDEYVEYVD